MNTELSGIIHYEISADPLQQTSSIRAVDGSATYPAYLLLTELRTGLIGIYTKLYNYLTYSSAVRIHL